MTKEEFSGGIRDNRRQARIDKLTAEREARNQARQAEREARMDKRVAERKAREAERKAALDKRLSERKAWMGKQQAARTARGTESRRSQMSGVKPHRGGGKVEMGYKKGGSVKSIDGIAQRGKTRGTMR